MGLGDSVGSESMGAWEGWNGMGCYGELEPSPAHQHGLVDPDA